MSNETDLDWLARNVHVWPAGDHQPWCYVYWKGGQRAVSGNCITVIWPCVRIEKAEWLARRSELQNKPSWDDAPSDMKWLSQDGDGQWCWYCSEPFVDETNDDKVWDLGDSFDHEGCEFGEVLGDWRDTLEKRPADLSEPAVTERLTEAAQAVLAAVPALMDEKYHFAPEFKPVTVSNETVQLERPIAVAGTGNGSAADSAFLIGLVIDLLRTSVDHFSADELADLNELTGAELTKRDAAVCGGQKYLDAHWFERGELPPVGCECEILGAFGHYQEWFPCKIIAEHSGSVFAANERSWMNVRKGERQFRPLRTERDVLIEIIKKTDDTDDRIADAILAAGFKRGAA